MKTLRWARENGCPWRAAARDHAAVELGYTDHFGNLGDTFGHLDEDLRDAMFQAFAQNPQLFNAKFQEFLSQNG